ncbi:MAG: hypothetical protein JKY13_02760 [Gammaproteobacteria bacterium]|nr:hypothetical protein [Gammaproteobacteria bacterium]
MKNIKLIPDVYHEKFNRPIHTLNKFLKQSSLTYAMRFTHCLKFCELSLKLAAKEASFKNAHYSLFTLISLAEIFFILKTHVDEDASGSLVTIKNNLKKNLLPTFLKNEDIVLIMNDFYEIIHYNGKNISPFRQNAYAFIIEIVNEITLPRQSLKNMPDFYQGILKNLIIQLKSPVATSRDKINVSISGKIYSLPHNKEDYNFISNLSILHQQFIFCPNEILQQKLLNNNERLQKIITFANTHKLIDLTI